MSSDGLKAPVMILGAPRSGTSLVQRILRGCEGCCAVAAESQHIWQRYTHPSRFDWKGESCDPTEIDQPERARIRRQFARAALPASLWRRVDAGRVVERQRRVGLPRWLLELGYTGLLAAKNVAGPPGKGLRLVDKSVHAGLWPTLVHRVFPEAMFVHVVRGPQATLSSMCQAWLEPGRFSTYRVPGGLRIPDCDERDWNLPLPMGWHDYTARRLDDIVAFQWCAVQTSILEYLSAVNVPAIRVRLEDLVADPRTEIERITTFANLAWDDHLEGFATALPRVNAGSGGSGRDWQSSDAVLSTEVSRIAQELGY